jgi:hypothetical protein
MSRLVFRRSFRKITLYSGYDIVGSWDAHNDVDRRANGIWPNGRYRWLRYNAHREEGLLPGAYDLSYGGQGIHIFSVQDRDGLGVHAGRTWGQPDTLGRVTMGCVRVTTEAMRKINQTHLTDPLTEIEISP